MRGHGNNESGRPTGNTKRRKYRHFLHDAIYLIRILLTIKCFYCEESLYIYISYILYIYITLILYPF